MTSNNTKLQRLHLAQHAGRQFASITTADAAAVGTYAVPVLELQYWGSVQAAATLLCGMTHVSQDTQLTISFGAHSAPTHVC